MRALLKAIDLESYDETSLSSDQIDEINGVDAHIEDSNELLKVVWANCFEKLSSIKKDPKDFDKLIKQLIKGNTTTSE